MVKKNKRLRMVDEMRKEDLRRGIAYYDKWANDERIAPPRRSSFAARAEEMREELAILDTIPETEYRN